MGLSWTLIRWQMRTMWFVNTAAGLAAFLYLLLRARPLTYDPPWWFPLVHAAAIAWFLGRTTTAEAGYLYLQGYSRDRLWWHNLASALGCAGCAWLPAALVVLSPLRAWCQDGLGNPYYPYMAVVDARFLWFCLWLYLVGVPVGLYVAARWAHPARGNDAGLVVACMLTVMLLTSAESARLWTTGGVWTKQWPMLALGLTAATIAAVTGRRLHREVEVRA